tara:strand:- start:166 stop:750 length:585 start_codon:yes stop_codon:yes gene_type:complete
LKSLILYSIFFLGIGAAWAAGSAQSYSSSDSLGNVCTSGSVFPLETEDVMSDYLLMLYANFDKEDQRGNPLIFGASKLRIEDGHLVITHPHLNQSPIKAYELVCDKKKENIFGAEVCAERSLRGTGPKLCEHLGLEPPIDEHRNFLYQNTSSLSHSKYYAVEENQWYSNRISMLAGRTTYQTLSEIRCQLKLPY